MAVGRWRWLVSAAALAALTVGSSLGGRTASAATTSIGRDHIVSPDTPQQHLQQQPIEHVDSRRVPDVFTLAKGGSMVRSVRL
jgi:hypothetical protein